MKKILFIDRDGTIVKEPNDYQLDEFKKLIFYPDVIKSLSSIYRDLDFEFVLITNQDGLGTKSFPEKDFWPFQNFIINVLEGEGVKFREILIDKTFSKENSLTRKPATGLVEKYINNDKYDLKNSFVIGDRLTDMEFAKNLNCKGIFICNDENLGRNEVKDNDLNQTIVLKTEKWNEIYKYLLMKSRSSIYNRKTNETNISVEINLDGTGESIINTGISFFDHMLDQLAKHGEIDLKIDIEGDLDIDEHHTIEDTAIALGKAFKKALGNKIGIERYGFSLPMDDSLAQVSLDFGGRSWLVWEADFNREMIGKMPTEMFSHFFKSFADSSMANINIKAEGENEHHKIEAIFKAFAKALKFAIKRDVSKMILPSTKGKL